jgi:hypothetical protein
MPRLRKQEAIMLSDDELYALMRATHPKVREWNPTGIELTLLNDAYNKINTEYKARAEEEQRMEAELEILDKEYKERNKYEHTN